jgi:dihydroflavonol-4-reductase
MRILVVGGTGALGAHAAEYLSQKGHEITISSRRDPTAATQSAKFQFLQGDYVRGDFTPDRLRGFDAVIFSAGNDWRHCSPDGSPEEQMYRANVEGIPRFGRAAREAGVKRLVYIGTFYPQAAPELLENVEYVRIRKLACDALLAEGRPGFDVIAVNPPFMVGGIPGMLNYQLDPYVEWAMGLIDAPVFAPAGATNYMSYRSLSQAVEGALLRGEPGKAYLVGDENLSNAEFFNLFFKEVGNPIRLESRDEPHPVYPDAVMIQGRGNAICYEPDPQETALLGYVRNDVANGIAEAVAIYKSTHADGRG